MDQHQAHLVKANCDHCGQAVYAHEGYYSNTGNHSRCESTTDAKWSSASARMDSALGNLGLKLRKARAKDGHGPVAKALRARLVPLIEAAAGEEVEELFLWVQPLAYRGPKWDLACWGGHATLKGTPAQVTVSSWATMTDCVRAAHLKLEPDGALSFDVLPRSGAL